MIRRMVKFWGRVEVGFFIGLKTKVDEGCFDDLFDSMTGLRTSIYDPLLSLRSIILKRNRYKKASIFA